MDTIEIKLYGSWDKPTLVNVQAKLFGRGNVAVHKSHAHVNLRTDEEPFYPQYVDGSYTLTHVPTRLAISNRPFGRRRNAWACAEELAVWFDSFSDEQQIDIVNIVTSEQRAEARGIYIRHQNGDS